VSAPEPPEPPPELLEGPPAEAVARMTISAPAERNPKLARLLEAADGDPQLKAWWYAAQTMADRIGMSDHSWVHVRIVLNIALRLYRLLRQQHVEPAMVTDHRMRAADAEVVIAAACLMHDTGMSIHRTDHEEYSLFLAARTLPSCSRASTRSPSGRWSWPRRCTRSSATAAAASR
jgi:uncharacterized protein